MTPILTFVGLFSIIYLFYLLLALLLRVYTPTIKGASAHRYSEF